MIERIYYYEKGYKNATINLAIKSIDENNINVKLNDIYRAGMIFPKNKKLLIIILKWT